MDGAQVVDNDGNAQSATSKCSIATLGKGTHNIYIEGWSKSSQLSMSATYQGPDTNNALVPIQAVTSPFAPSNSYSTFRECDPTSSSANMGAGKGKFTICGFRVDSTLDLHSVDDVHALYSAVRARGLGSD